MRDLKRWILISVLPTVFSVTILKDIVNGRQHQTVTSVGGLSNVHCSNALCTNVSKSIL